MIELLSRIFINNRNETDNPEVREKWGILCGFTGIMLNVLLFAGKMIAGFLAHSVAIVADAVNNISDAASSLIVLIGFKLSGKKPDPDHPFGHGRIEYVSGLIVSMLILFMAWELASSSVEKIIRPEIPSCSTLIIVILTASVLVKLYMFLYNRKIGNRINSASMHATAADSVSDMITTAVTLLCTMIGARYDLAIDGWCGIVVSVLVIKSGVGAFRDTLNPLLGTPPDPEFVKSVEEIVTSQPGILDVHDLVVHNYGPGRIFVSVHAEVPSDGDIVELHDVIDNAEKELADKLKCEAVIHMDPVCVDDEETNRLKQIASEAMKRIDPEIRFHDFRIVKGPTHTNVLFDCLVPYDYVLSDDEIRTKLTELIHEKEQNVNLVVTVDKEYIKK